MVGTKQKQQVAVLAFPFGTHAAPLLSLARILAESAPDLEFSFFSTAKSNASLSPMVASFGPIDNLRLYDVANGVPENHVLSKNPMEEIELFFEGAAKNFQKALERVKSGGRGGNVEEELKLSCLLTDSFLSFAGQMAEDLGVSWISLWTSSLGSLSAHRYTDLLRLSIGTNDSSRLDETLAFIPGFDTVRVRDLPEGIVFGPLDSLFARILHLMANEMSRTTAVVVNSFEALDSSFINDHRAKLRHCLLVGPLSLMAPPLPISANDPYSCLNWLDTLAGSPFSVAYISFGTVTSPPPVELKSLAEGLEASGAHFLWSLKDGLKEDLPNGFLDRTKGRGLVVPWAPQSKLLAHTAVGAFLTHCGWNSVMESITGGVPMLCRPFFGDQQLNRQLVSHVWEIGFGAEGGVLTRDGVVEGLELLLRKEEGKKMRENVRKLKELAEGAVKEGGSSTKNLEALLGIIKRGVGN